MVTTKLLDNDHCKSIECHFNKYFKHCESNNTENTHKEDEKLKQLKRQPKRWYCFMVLKIALIVLRFTFRLLIVPLLQLQWLNSYTWNCIMNNFLRNYCETEASMYYIDLDHSFVLYSVYVLVIVALLFSLMINWFPSGIPQVVLRYSTLETFKIKEVMIRKKGDQFAYHIFENEEQYPDENPS